MAGKSDTDAELLERASAVSLRELCQVCGIHAEMVMEMVEFGILEPVGRPPSEWQFPAVSLVRSKRALRLVRDLQLNLAGAALALELLDEMDEMRRQMNMMEQRLQQLLEP